MSNSLMNTAMSGLNAAQYALSTVSNNITNFQVAGYNRQNTVFAQNGGTITSAGFIGNGVTVTGVNREYNAFITNQLRASQTQSSGLATYYQQISQIDNLLSNASNNLSTTMQDFFSNLQNLVSNADDDAARKTVLGKAEGLVNQFQNADKYLRDMDDGVNQKITDSATQINNYAEQIAKLNDQITRLRGSSGSEPNALLDQRDQLVTELNQIMAVTVTQQDGDAYNVSFAGGLSLVQGPNAYKVEAIPSSADATRLTLGYKRGNGEATEVDESRITTGSLGGTLKFRSEALDSARNQLGQLALVMADSFNTQHNAGFDINGDEGEDFFSFADPTVLKNAKNQGNASITVEYKDTSKVKASDYTVEFDGTDWQVTRLSDNTKVQTTPGVNADGDPTLEFEGVAIKIDNGTPGPQAKDKFTIKTVSNVAANLQVAITDSSKIAAAGSADGGISDNTNAQALLDLQSKKLVEGKTTLSGAYAGLVSNVGNQTATAKTNSTAQANIVTQLTTEQQSISGVNLDEEYGDLQRFQQYYLANAQVLQAASTLFNALLSISD
ncbi:flagellar hook-associated protein FlgK [Yersinia pestis]|uniref:Flagellar hook-associated protein 1 n=14 Tax=Yersinia pseudotuberculosis complex TaxID=1649845 RepID=A0AAX2I621_YERPE|nr:MULTISPECIES: flagellar hook-associated protein FlgK [Yersinia pseudotuberculosis complex]EDR32000.1 flagellar hook-associated protein FlgK [Yersinia pestis biovar Orientalis str. IP275]EFA45920.1 flagellar hook-associated protein FlgK [Yersinia pestis KIM D27]ERP73976.1 flagellar hook-associated protein FlgK [Yersinia pestis S3]ERP74706.1 flagellar hook-associated protein FlgK [Yersinia pestis 24H]ERP82983.1 flagellar hook-associated protein FlgK [Yersinia pestis 9]CQD52837.1 flagellar ho